MPLIQFKDNMRLKAVFFCSESGLANIFKQDGRFLLTFSLGLSNEIQIYE